jgi:hypothetical protein
MHLAADREGVRFGRSADVSGSGPDVTASATKQQPRLFVGCV